MKIVYTTATNVASAIKNLNSLPVMGKYAEKLGSLQHFADMVIYFRDNASFEQLREDLIMVRNGDGLYNVLGPELESQLRNDMQKASDLFKDILSDEELMGEEPFLKECLRFLSNNLERELSDDPQALNYRNDPAMTLPSFLLDELNHIPSKAELEENGQTEIAEKLTAHLKAINDHNEYTWNIQKNVSQNGTLPVQEEYCEHAGELLTNIKESAGELKSLTEDDLEGFIDLINKNKDHGRKQRAKNAIQEENKMSLHHVPGSTDRQRHLIGNHVLPDEQALLYEFTASVNRVISDYRGGGTKLQDLKDPFKDIIQHLADLSQECSSHMENGFENIEDKLRFFVKLDKGIKDFQNKTADIHPSNAVNNIDNDPNIKKAKNMILDLRQIFASTVSVDKRVSCMSSGYAAVEKSADNEFRKKIYDFCDMMTDTKNGYLGHRNSRQYTDMLDTARHIMDMSSKENLTDLEFRNLSESYNRLADRCEKYLNRKEKLRKQNSDAGEDRFDAALGILNLLDPDRASKIVEAANQKRSKKVSLADIMEKSERKTSRREEKNGARTYTAPALNKLTK